MGLFACAKFLTGTWFCSIGSCGHGFLRQHWKSAFSHGEPPPFCLSSPPRTSLSLSSPLLCSWSCSRRNLERGNILTLILYWYVKWQMPLAVWHISSAALCPSRSPSAISPANHPLWMWLCHWELKVPLECIWKACGYVLFDIMTNPSCTAGCRIALKVEAFPVSGFARLLGRAIVT